ncbi:hypothetical protein C8J56DRAFT_899171 [Mycena floridula]|nr:hypothetical protein C8J56DRAFT_899171 [Mycena floridula]
MSQAAQRTSNIYYILENTDTEITYGGGGQWSTFQDNYYSQDSATWASFDGILGRGPGTIELSFDASGITDALRPGTEIIFVGFTGFFNGTATPQGFTVAIDSNTAYSTSTGDRNPPSYIQWYQSPQLEPGIHSIKLDKLNGTGVDYILVSPGQDTPLTNRLLVVDDSYIGIDYENHWESDSHATVQGNGSAITGVTFQNTTHQTSIEGSYLKFSYSGTSASVYGMFSWIQPGSYDLTINVDDQIPFTVTFNSSAPHHLDSDAPDQPNLKLFSTGDLPPGNHTIVANLTRCDTQTLIIDYIEYSPSFSSLATMPNLTKSTGSATGPSNIPTVITPNPKKSSAGAIAGGVIGSLTLLVIAALLFLWWRRRNTTTSQSTIPPDSRQAFRSPGNLTIEPFVHAPAATVSTTEAVQSSSDLTPLRRNSDSDPTSSGASFTGTAFTAPTSFRPEIRQRMLELQQLLEEAAHGRDNGDTRRQIRELREENERLTRIAQPPAYWDSSINDSVSLSPSSKLEPLRGPSGDDTKGGSAIS